MQATGVDQALWLPGVGDHGGGPTQEMLDQLQLWDRHPQSVSRSGGTVRGYLQLLEPWTASMPIWRDELYLELHRGCATSRPDQKRHNRTLERLLREADLLEALGAVAMPARDWPTLLFQQFHDILPGTSIPEVFDQADFQWRRARRQAATARTEGLRCLLEGKASSTPPAPAGVEPWAWCGLQPLQRWSPLLKLPSGDWRCQGRDLPVQQAAGGGVWVQLPEAQGIVALPLERRIDAIAGCPASEAIRHSIWVQNLAEQHWRLGNVCLALEVDERGQILLQDAQGVDQLSSPVQIKRYRTMASSGMPGIWRATIRSIRCRCRCDGRWRCRKWPLLARVVLRGSFGDSTLRMDLILRADTPWLELQLTLDWHQTHELLRMVCPLAAPAVRWAADTSGGVLERPAAVQHLVNKRDGRCR